VLLCPKCLGRFGWWTLKSLAGAAARLAEALARATAKDGA
jgi:hypothetical protein